MWNSMSYGTGSYSIGQNNISYGQYMVPLNCIPEYIKLINMGYKPVYVYSTKFGKFIDEHFPKLSNLLKIKKLKVEHILQKGRTKVVCSYSDEKISCKEVDGYYTINTPVSDLKEVIFRLKREDKLKRLLKNNI